MSEMKSEGLKGYSLPFSPTGRSSLVPAPPWHFSGEVMMIEFRADPVVLQSFLPRDLDHSGDGLAAAIFGDWQSCGSAGAELLDPVRAQYKEFYIAVSCQYQGKPVVRCPCCWVDQDFSLVRGLIQGYPKKLGRVSMTRAFSVGQATPPVGAGGKFGGSLAAGDRRLVQAEVVLERPDEVPPLMLAPLVHTRYFPAWDPATPGTEELVMSGSSEQAVADVWSGSADLTFYDSPTDDLALLAPVEILRGYRFSFAETITGGTLLSRNGR